ncbi:hypothetical protein GUT184_04140 [Streptococcus ruminantium]|nr:hypothetical protein GUT183_04520 [Streptococcus ruminantium]BDD40150.1 hypothetical protein GUT184_04140 [Streptococcus ruminantium]
MSKNKRNSQPKGLTISRRLYEKELLALKGIGPATIKQLKELGIKLKK